MKCMSTQKSQQDLLGCSLVASGCNPKVCMNFFSGFGLMKPLGPGLNIWQYNENCPRVPARHPLDFESWHHPLLNIVSCSHWLMNKALSIRLGCPRPSLQICHLRSRPSRPERLVEDCKTNMGLEGRYGSDEELFPPVVELKFDMTQNGWFFFFFFSSFFHLIRLPVGPLHYFFLLKIFLFHRNIDIWVVYSWQANSLHHGQFWEKVMLTSHNLYKNFLKSAWYFATRGWTSYTSP